ncbi:hypothetical protein D9M69_705270 [compost metagenome]
MRATPTDRCYLVDTLLIKPIKGSMEYQHVQLANRKAGKRKCQSQTGFRFWPGTALDPPEHLRGLEQPEQRDQPRG